VAQPEVGQKCAPTRAGSSGSHSDRLPTHEIETSCAKDKRKINRSESRGGRPPA
jgi:hypothetical protein